MAKIVINGISIDPQAQQHEASFARLVSSDSSRSNYILVQTTGPPDRRQKDELGALDVELLEYVPEDAYICYYQAADLDAVRALPFVEWVNIYLEGFKLPPHIRSDVDGAAEMDLLALGEVTTSMSQQPREVVVIFHQHTLDEGVREKIAVAARLDPGGLELRGNSIRLTVQPQHLPDLAKIDEVRHIEEYAKPKLHNNVALQIIAADETHSSARLEGEGQIVAVCDTGFDSGSAVDVHPAFEDRVVKLYNLGRSSANDPHGHGTHVAGSVLGDGRSGAAERPVRGTAPKAKLVMQSVLDHDGGLGGLPDDLNDLFLPSYRDDGARVHTNSWGVGESLVAGRYWLGRYTANAEQIDRFVWEHRDLVVCFSAGNEGTDSDGDGAINNGSVTPPGTAKNCITVGATESNRPDQSKPYGEPWPDDFPTDPISSDMWADNPAGLAAFSGRGPTRNGRIKPDVVAPGTSILSAHSRDAHVGSFWGTSSDALYAFMGGTSMATPLVAGCAAIVREYFQIEHQHEPSAALVKAMLINGAQDISGQYSPSEAQKTPNVSEGFGRVDLAATVGPYDDAISIIFSDENAELDTGEEEDRELELSKPGSSLKATLVWADPPGEALQNDLDLVVHAADGEERHGNMSPGSSAFDRSNNVEQVLWSDMPVGQVRITVRAHRVTRQPQSYALVIRTTGRQDGADDTDLEVLDVRLLRSGISSLLAEVRFRIHGADAEMLTNNRSPFQVEVSAMELDSDDAASQLVAAEEGLLESDVLEYTMQLHFPLLNPGRYELRTSVALRTLSGEEIRAGHNGPVFRVTI